MPLHAYGRPSPRRSWAAFVLVIVTIVLATLRLASAQTPDEANCSIQWSGDKQAEAACLRCQAAKDERACMCAALPRLCAPAQGAGKLALAVSVTLGEARVPGAHVTVTAGGVSQERTADASGDALFDLALPTPDPRAKTPSAPKVTVHTVALGASAKVPGLRFPTGTSELTLTLDRDVPLAKGDTSKRMTVALPAAKLVLSSLARDPKTGTWAPAPARVDFFLGKQKVFSMDNGTEAKTTTLLVPPDQVGRDYRVQAGTTDGTKLRDTTSFRIPAPGGTAFLTVYLGDLMTQLERARAKLNGMLAQAYGPEIADRITRGVRFELGDVGTPSYDAGVLRIPKNYTLGSDGEMENLFHEWGHRVQDVLAHDVRASFSVGGRTESPWAPDPDKNDWRAFDEARANFYSQLFTASLRYPGDKTYTEEAAKPHAGKCGTCPGYLAAAMVAHYRDPKLYANALEIARDVRDVHDEAVRTLGHPPRTYAELVRAKESLTDRQRTEGTITAARAQAIKTQLRDTNTRFRL